jgi:hypothetical protein
MPSDNPKRPRPRRRGAPTEQTYHMTAMGRYRTHVVRKPFTWTVPAPAAGAPLADSNGGALPLPDCSQGTTHV